MSEHANRMAFSPVCNALARVAGNRLRPIHYAPLFALLVLSHATVLRAANVTWKGATSSDWNTASNWSPGSVPDTAGETAYFDGSGTNAVTFGAAVGGGSGFGGILVDSTQTSVLSINSNGGALTNFRLSSATGITINAGAGAFSLGTSGSNIQLVPQTATTFTFANNSSNIATLGSKITSTTGGGGSAFGMLFTGSGDWQVDAALNPSGGGSPSFLTKQGTGTLTVTGTNTYTGITTISDGMLVMANTQALGTNTAFNAITFTGTTAILDIATDGGDTAYNTQVGSGVTATVSSNVKTGSVGINHTLGKLNIGGVSQVNAIKGSAVASGSPSITFGAVTLGAGNGAGPTTFNPTTADLILGTVTSTTSTTGTKILILDGTSSGNRITGAISNGGGTAIAVTKSNSSTWTLSGNNTYTGVTNVDAGELIVNGTHTGGGTYTVASGARLGGDGTISADVVVASSPGELSPGDAGSPSSYDGSFSYSAGQDSNTVGSLAVVGDVNLGGFLLLDVTNLGHDMLNIMGDFEIVTNPNAQLEINGTTDLTQIDFWGILGWTTAGPSIDLVTFSTFGGGEFANIAFNHDFTDAGGHNVLLGLDGDSIFLLAVPEPQSVALWTLIGLIAVSFVGWRAGWTG